MRFTQDSSSGTNVIRAYGAGELKINDAVFRGPVIVSSSAIVPGPSIGSADELDAAHAPPILALEPEVVLLGTGARQTFPAAIFGAQFLRVGIGFEVMDTGAACRTFNVLVAEQRQVVALLLP
jgi:uncharacterized protein